MELYKKVVLVEQLCKVGIVVVKYVIGLMIVKVVGIEGVGEKLKLRRLYLEFGEGEKKNIEEYVKMLIDIENLLQGIEEDSMFRQSIYGD